MTNIHTPLLCLHLGTSPCQLRKESEHFSRELQTLCRYSMDHLSRLSRGGGRGGGGGGGKEVREGERRGEEGREGERRGGKGERRGGKGRGGEGERTWGKGERRWGKGEKRGGGEDVREGGEEVRKGGEEGRGRGGEGRGRGGEGREGERRWGGGECKTRSTHRRRLTRWVLLIFRVHFRLSYSQYHSWVVLGRQSEVNSKAVRKNWKVRKKAESFEAVCSVGVS